MLSIIAAVAENNCIGNGNEMPWHLPADLKRLKELTYGKTIVMGIKTFLSLKKPLKGRRHIVLTRNASKYEEFEDVEYCSDAEKVFVQGQASEEEIFVFGGGEIYKKAMPYCRRLYITEILESFVGDTFFPEIDLEVFEKISLSEIFTDEKSSLRYRYAVYEERK